MPCQRPLRRIAMPPPSARGAPSFITRSGDTAGLRHFLNNNTGNVMNATNYCCRCLQVRGWKMTSLMARAFRFLTRSALTRLTSVWETRHISLLTDTVNNVSKIDVYAHIRIPVCVSGKEKKNKKKDCSLTGSRQRQTQNVASAGGLRGPTLTGPHVHSSEGFFQPRRKLATSLRSRPNNAVLFPLNRADEEPGPAGIREDISRSAEITRHRSLRPRL